MSDFYSYFLMMQKLTNMWENKIIVHFVKHCSHILDECNYAMFYELKKKKVPAGSAYRRKQILKLNANFINKMIKI